MSTLPPRLPAPAACSAPSDTPPDVQLNKSSPNAAASAKVPSDARAPVLLTHATDFSLPALREPMRTSWPTWTSFVAIALPTMPVPKTPIFIVDLPARSLARNRARAGLRKLHADVQFSHHRDRQVMASRLVCTRRSDSKALRGARAGQYGTRVGGAVPFITRHHRCAR